VRYITSHRAGDSLDGKRTEESMPGPIRVTIRDGRVGREDGAAGVTPEGHGAILETRDCGEPFRLNDRLTLSDGTEVVAIGVDNHLRPNHPWEQTVHIGDVF
jgi:hypothetical protein